MNDELHFFRGCHRQSYKSRKKRKQGLKKERERRKTMKKKLEREGEIGIERDREKKLKRYFTNIRDKILEIVVKKKKGQTKIRDRERGTK